MSWHCGQQMVAEPHGATVSGTNMAGGAQVHIDVAFRLVEWPWAGRGPLSLVLPPIEMTARAGRGERRTGVELPTPASEPSPVAGIAVGRRLESVWMAPKDERFQVLAGGGTTEGKRNV